MQPLKVAFFSPSWLCLEIHTYTHTHAEILYSSKNDNAATLFTVDESSDITLRKRQFSKEYMQYMRIYVYIHRDTCTSQCAFHDVFVLCWWIAFSFHFYKIVLAEDSWTFLVHISLDSTGVEFLG